MKPLFKQLCILIGLTLPALAAGGVMNLFSGFSVEREVPIDTGHSYKPLALLRAADGGYFILEGGYGNGVVKTDSRGQTQWVYREPGWGIQGHQPDTAVEFTSAGAASDGGVLLGGHRARPSEHYVDAFAGVLIRLDKDGHVVGRVDPGLQQVLKQVDLFDVYAISRWGDGFAAIGAANHKQVVLRLRDDGSIAWQKELVTRGSVESLRPEARALLNGDLAIQGLGNFARIDPDGHTLQEVELDASCRWVTYIKPTEENYFLCPADSGDTSMAPGILVKAEMTPEILEVKSDKKTVLRVPWPKLKKVAGNIGPSRVYAVANSNYVLFGETSSSLHRSIPVVAEINSGGSIVAKKEFIGLEEMWIEDGMPTDLPGEYVVIRPVMGDRGGTIMTFLRRD